MTWEMISNFYRSMRFLIKKSRKSIENILKLEENLVVYFAHFARS